METLRSFGLAALLSCTVSTALSAKSDDTFELKNDDYSIRLVDKTSLEIRHGNSAPRVFTSEFTLLFTTENPKKSERRPDVGYNQKEKILYKVPTWGREELLTIDPKEHVMDGFNPATDRGLEEGRTANYFLAAPNQKITASEVKLAGDAIQWIYPDNDKVQLSAKITLPEGDGSPELSLTFKSIRDGYYSIGYTGAPQVSPGDMDEMWQPLIWQEKRFPNLPYLTEAFLCTVPSTLVSHEGITVGVLADPQHLPFMPLPKSRNSQFGVMVRNGRGEGATSPVCSCARRSRLRSKSGAIFHLYSASDLPPAEFAGYI